MESGFGEALGPMLKAWKWEDEEQGESESSPVKFESLSEEQREATSSHTGSGFSLTYLLLEGQTCQQTSLVPVGMDLMKVFIRREKTNHPSNDDVAQVIKNPTYLIHLQVADKELLGSRSHRQT